MQAAPDGKDPDVVVLSALVAFSRTATKIAAHKAPLQEEKSLGVEAVSEAGPNLPKRFRPA